MRHTNNTKNRIRFFSIVTLFSCIIQICFAQNENHRLVILADMGNEPDEVQQIVHLMMYSNEIDIEGLIAVTGTHLHSQHEVPYRRFLYPELFHEIINGYEKVLPNLQKHAAGWPEPEYLRSIVASGQTGYGIEDTGEGKSSEGSDLIKQSLLSDDPRLLYIVVNAGSNTLAQAMIELRDELSNKELKSVIKKMRVFENGAQDNAGAWICAHFPDIWWIRSNYQTYSYGGPGWAGLDRDVTNLGPHTWEPYEYSSLGQHHWALTNIIADHGLLGMVYPLRQSPSGRIVFIEGGGTVPWLGLIHRGLWDITHPGWGGWSGRYSKEKVKNPWSKYQHIKADEEKYDDFYMYVDVPDHWVDTLTSIEYNNLYTPVWRWRWAYFNDFKCRMDWCVEEYENANHHPVTSVNGISEEKIHTINAQMGEIIMFDATASSDPDGDNLSFCWWIYQEAGTYQKHISLKNQNQPLLTFEIPNDAKGEEIHLILEVSDQNEIASLSDYRRIVINVNQR